MNEDYNEMNAAPDLQPQPAVPATLEKQRSLWPGIIAGFLLGVIAVTIGLILWQGYVMIPMGKLGVLTIRMPYYNDSVVADDGSLNTTEINRKMEEIQDLVEKAYLYDADPKRVSDGIFTGMLYGLTDQDKYAQYYSAEAFEEENKRNNGAYDGIGVTVQTDEETGGMLVVSVNSQGPAKAAGIQVDEDRKSVV